MNDLEQIAGVLNRHAEVLEVSYQGTSTRDRHYMHNRADAFRRAAKLVANGHCGAGKCEVCGRLTKIEGDTRLISLDGEPYLLHVPPPEIDGSPG